MSPPSCRRSLRDCLGHGQHLVGFGANANVLSEVLPTHGAGGIHQELCRPGDIASVRAAAHVQQVIAANHLGLGIGEKWEGISGLAAQVAGNLRRVNADGDGPDAGVVELTKILLYASQLEVTVRSPVAAVEDQQNTFGRFAGRGVDRRLQQLRK